MSKQLKVLFISRAYPPVLGGIENQNHGIAHALKEVTPTTIIANKKGKKFLPFFLPYAFAKMLILAPKYDVILLGDGVLAPLGKWVKTFHKKIHCACIVHGLDITYAQKNSLFGRIYRTINIPALDALDKLIMVGNHTVEKAIEAGIAGEKCVYIPNGLSPENVCMTFTREDLEDHFNLQLEDKKVIVRIGRFVKHKGVPWFLEYVMPHLPENYIFIAAGGRVAARTAGDEDAYAEAARIVKEKKLEHRVYLHTNVPWAEIKLLLNTADVVVSPNINVPGSMEGFGINAIEASVCGCVVLASNFQGLKDAIQDGKNGFLVEHESSGAWITKINEVLKDDFDRVQFGKLAQNFTIKNYSWPHIAELYINELTSLKKNTHTEIKTDHSVV